MHELAAHYGEEKLAQYMTELVDYAERMTRAAISDLPDGVYDFLDHIDDDGIDVGRPIPLKVDDHQDGRPDRGRLDRHLAAGQGRDQQHAQLYEIGELLRDPLDPAAEHPDQRGRVPRDLGHRARGHDRQLVSARRLRGARPHRVPHGRLHVRRAGENAAGPGVRGLRRRQYRRLDRRLARATARRSSMSISPAAPGARGPMPTGSTATRTSTPTWPRSRSR